MKCALFKCLFLEFFKEMNFMLTFRNFQSSHKWVDLHKDIIYNSDLTKERPVSVSSAADSLLTLTVHVCCHFYSLGLSLHDC